MLSHLILIAQPHETLGSVSVPSLALYQDKMVV